MNTVQIQEFLDTITDVSGNFKIVVINALEIIMESNAFDIIKLDDITHDDIFQTLELSLVSEDGTICVGTCSVQCNKIRGIYQAIFKHETEPFRNFQLNTSDELIKEDYVSFESDEFISLNLIDNEDQIVVKRSDIIMKYTLIPDEDGNNTKRSWALHSLKDEFGKEYDLSQRNILLEKNAEDLVSLAEFGYVKAIDSATLLNVLPVE